MMLAVTLSSATAYASFAQSATTLPSTIHAVGQFQPRSTGLPTISGTVVPGQTLTATQGPWANSPTTYAWQWKRCDATGNNCTNISAATASTYVPGAEDAEYTLRVDGTASNAGGSATATSLQTTLVSGRPVNTGAPGISGVAEPGQTLSATPGTWIGTPTPTYTYQWQQCNAAGEACTTIAGATASGYAPVEGDLGHTLRVAVTATNTAGSAEVTSSASALVMAPPFPTVFPTISGAAQQGVTLTATAGTWTGYPTPTFSYLWQRCDSSGNSCITISGAKASTYVPAAGDVEHTLRVVVSATNTVETVSAASADGDGQRPPVNSVLPVISGSALQGQTMTVTTGTWSGSPTPAYTYQWKQCNAEGEACTTITGATATGYAPEAGDLGHTLRVVVTATKIAGSASATSEKSAAITTPPANTSLPSVSGTAQQGQTLTATPGTWAGSPTPTYAYQWKQCNSSGEACTTITGATASTYVPVAGDGGLTIRVAVTATNSTGSASATSLPTSLVLAPPVNTALPSVSGTAQQGKTLTGTTGAWTGYAAPTYAYQWQQCDAAGNNCTTIVGATATTYVPVLGDGGHTLRLAVTATNTAANATATSTQTAAVATPPVNTVLPSISGTVQQGQTLTSTTGTWTGTPAPTYAYQWQRCDSAGNSCAGISAATASTYVLVEADGGHTIRVAVTATNSAAGVTATSAQTILDGSAPVNTVAPGVSGTAKQEYALSGTVGTWSGAPAPTYTYQWQRCNGACANIGGATVWSYKATASDVGYTLRFGVTATNVVGSATAYSAQTATVVIAPPVNIVLPCIIAYTEPPSGPCATQLFSENSFMITSGTWTNSPTSYKWHTYGPAQPWDLGELTYEERGLVGVAENDKCYSEHGWNYSVVTATNAGGSTSVAIRLRRVRISVMLSKLGLRHCTKAGASTSPSGHDACRPRTASATACTRVLAPSLLVALRTCVRTVSGERYRRSAIP